MIVTVGQDRRARTICTSYGTIPVVDSRMHADRFWFWYIAIRLLSSDISSDTRQEVRKYRYPYCNRMDICTIGPLNDHTFVKIAKTVHGARTCRLCSIIEQVTEAKLRLIYRETTAKGVGIRKD